MDIRGRLVVLALAFCVCASAAPAASAATFTVSSAAENGAGTFSQAVSDANAHDSPGDVIDFNQAALAGAAIETGTVGYVVTDPGLTIDGCSGGTLANGPCQAVDASSQSTVDSNSELFEVDASDVTIQGLDVTGVPNDILGLNDDSGANDLTLLADTFDSSDADGAVIDSSGDGLQVGGLDGSNQPQDGVTIDTTGNGIELSAGNDDSIEGNQITVSGSGTGLEIDAGEIKGTEIVANAFAGGPSAGGIYDDSDAAPDDTPAEFTKIGDANRQAPANTFDGLGFPVFVDAEASASAYLYDNTGTATGNGAAFYMVALAAPAFYDYGEPPDVPTITTATSAAVSGTGDPGDTVELLNAGDTGPAGDTTELDGVLGTATVDGDGNWTFTPSSSITSGFVSALETSATTGSSPNAGSVAVVGTVVPPVSYTVTATASGAGSVAITSTNADANCSGASCSAQVTVDAGNQAVITATPASGYTFAGWSGACSGTGAVCTLRSIAAAQSTTANFIAQQPPTQTTTTTTTAATPTTTTPTTTAPARKPVLTNSQQAALLKAGLKATANSAGTTISAAGLRLQHGAKGAVSGDSFKVGGYALTINRSHGRDVATPLVFTTEATSAVAEFEQLIKDGKTLQLQLARTLPGKTAPAETLKLTDARMVAIEPARGEVALGFAKLKLSFAQGSRTIGLGLGGSADKQTPEPVAANMTPPGSRAALEFSILRASGSTSQHGGQRRVPNIEAEGFTGEQQSITDVLNATAADTTLNHFDAATANGVATPLLQSAGLSALKLAGLSNQRALFAVAKTGVAPAGELFRLTLKGLHGIQLRIAGAGAEFELAYQAAQLDVFNRSGVGTTTGWNRVVNTGA
jgi:hypothetical protein